MKVEVHEFSNIFCIELIAENEADAVKILRMKMNCKKEVRDHNASVYEKDGIHSWITFPRTRNPRASIR